MSAELTFLSALLIGLLGSTHCIGMCGGIVGVLSLGLPVEVRHKSSTAFGHQLAYNLGRISSYVAIGTLAAWLGSGLHDMPRLAGIPMAPLIAASFMVALGLYLANWWQGLLTLEKLGGRLWLYIEPVARKFLPARNHPEAFMLGVLWGWLPCGLVYSVLAWALTTGDPLQGAALMAGFGLGTMPAMILLGSSLARLKGMLQAPLAKGIAGSIVICTGVFTGMQAFDTETHQHHSSGHTHTMSHF